MRNNTWIRCQCGAQVNVSIPSRCRCGDLKSYWKTGDGKVIKVSQMTLGHLSNSIRILGERAGEVPMEERERIEIALDMLYAELGTRDTEITQATGIMAALTRSIPK